MQTYSSVASETVPLGHDNNNKAATMTIQGGDSGWSGTVIVKGKVQGGATGYVPIDYKSRCLAGTAGDSAISHATITDTAFLIEVPCAGMDIALVITRSAGTLVLEWETVDA